MDFKQMEYIKDIIERIEVGRGINFSRSFIESAWPDRGRDLFQNIALAVGNHRPEPIESTLLQFQRWANQFDGVSIRQNIQDGEFEVIKQKSSEVK